MKPRKETSVLTEANNLVHGERNESYGHPLDDFSRTAKIWSAILGIGVTPEQVGLCMIGVKISRQCNAPKRDNMVDAAGYAETVDWVMEEKERRRKTWVEVEEKKLKKSIAVAEMTYLEKEEKRWKIEKDVRERLEEIKNSKRVETVDWVEEKDEVQREIDNAQ